MFPTGFPGGTGVNITPNANGLPGIGALANIVGALITIGVIAAVAGLALAAITWAVGNHSSNPQLASRGKTSVLVAAVAAVLCGGAMVLIIFFFNIGTGL